MVNLEELREKLSRLRWHKKVTLGYVARETGVSVSTLSRFENGKTATNLFSVQAIEKWVNKMSTQEVKKFADIAKYQGKRFKLIGMEYVCTLLTELGTKGFWTFTYPTPAFVMEKVVTPDMDVIEITPDCEFCTVPCGKCEKPVETTQEGKTTLSTSFTWEQWQGQATRLRKEGYEKGRKDMLNWLADSFMLTASDYERALNYLKMIGVIGNE